MADSSSFSLAENKKPEHVNFEILHWHQAKNWVSNIQATVFDVKQENAILDSNEYWK